MIHNPAFLSSQEVLNHFKSNPEQGLTKKQAQKNILKYGKNSISKKYAKTPFQILLEQFLHPILYILSAAALLAFLFSDYIEGFAILVVIFITVTIGFFMELQAEHSLEKLRKLGQPIARVVRDGKIISIRTLFIVPGDILLVERGDIISADARLITEDNLSLKESVLTGESIPIKKTIAPLPENTPLMQQTNMLFSGTMVVSGSGKAVITATGDSTGFGKIHKLGIEAKKEQTPLEKKLNSLSVRLIWLTLFFVIAIVFLGWLRGKELFLMIETGIALAVATIPEGLPIVATIALAQGMLRLSKKNIIIKNLEAVQTLGATTIICTDKTGTLTEDKIKAHYLAFEDNDYEDIYQFDDKFFKTVKQEEAFEKLMSTAILCNNVTLELNSKHGDSIDVALIEFAQFTGYDAIAFKKNNPEILEIPFDEELKMMLTVHQNIDFYEVYAKGAFEVIAQNCNSVIKEGKTIAFETKEKWFEKVDKMASLGYRTLAFAYKKSTEKPTKENCFKDLIFIGVIGFIDPARKDVAATISLYKKAGIKVVMITGDHPGTSKKIAEEIGLINNNKEEKVILGESLANMKKLSHKEKLQMANTSIFARVTPEQKLKLVTFLQKQNNIVGMLGDGINDIPALKKADIGIAMGIRGTEAAREVADVILKDDKFTSIEMAIHQGRVIFQNIRQFIVYLLSSNLAEIFAVGLAALFNLPAPLLPLQILFLNLITDIFPALALGLGKGDTEIMQQAPRKADEPIMTPKMWRATFIYGLCLSASVLGVTIYASDYLHLEHEQTNNLAFYTIIFSQLLNVFNMPKKKMSFFKNEVTTNPWIWTALIFCVILVIIAYNISPVAFALSMVPISLSQLGTVILFGCSSLVLAQMIKRTWDID